MDHAHILAIFLTQLIVLMLVGRLLGEVMTRIGQPAIFGQLLAGVALGPSLFGAVLPSLHDRVFPDSPELKTMIDAISQVGILLLLLLTGMETNLELVRRRFGVVVATSVTGIAIPFACGLALGFLLPVNLVPDEGRQLVTALFIGTALSISSVKIVAMVLMEVGFIRRDLGQLILATAILDDTIAWILVAVIAGIAAQGSISLGQIAFSIAGVVVFLGLSLVFGRHLVARLIRWSNDSLTIEFPVITAVLVVTLSLALLTDLIGVHSALGAFVSGVLIGQSPILKGHIEQELRGLIIAFFSPVFFAVAGLSMDLTTLAEPNMLLLALAFVVVGSVGKSLGAMIGGRIAGLSGLESLALATGLNARGSTEVIIATIGMSMGVLNKELYTLIVAMAMITTMIMPPTLRWALGRVPLREDERARLEKEEADEKDHLPNMERVLVVVDDSANAAQALRLSGAFAAAQNILTTVMNKIVVPEDNTTDGTDTDGEKPGALAGVELARTTAEAALAKLESDMPPASDSKKSDAAQTAPIPLADLIRSKALEDPAAGEAEIVKGYNLLFIGYRKPFNRDGSHFAEDVDRLFSAADLPAVISLNGTHTQDAPDLPRNILVAADGTKSGNLATEIAVALARVTGGRLTVLHVIEPAEESGILRGMATGPLSSILNHADVHARRHGIAAVPVQVVNPHPHRVIRRMAASGRFDLVVLGATLRQDGEKLLGPRTRDLVRSLRAPLLLIVK
ncbi:MAG: cation:proton antiporter [Cypionkella sp.]